MRLRVSAVLVAATLCLVAAGHVDRPAGDWSVQSSVLLGSPENEVWTLLQALDQLADALFDQSVTSVAIAGSDITLNRASGGSFVLHVDEIDTDSYYVVMTLTSHTPWGVFEAGVDATGTRIYYAVHTMSSHQHSAMFELGIEVKQTGDAMSQQYLDVHMKTWADLLVSNVARFCGHAVCPTMGSSLDSSCNNQDNPQFGAAPTPLLRLPLHDPDFGDGVSSPSGAGRPSARAISNAVCDQDREIPEPTGTTDMFVLLGQFLDHDLSLTPEGNADTGEFGQAIFHEEFPIYVDPATDPAFSSFDANDPNVGITETSIHFGRAIWMRNTVQRSSAHRVFPNTISAWLDLGSVYGSDYQRMELLRSYADGKLKIRPDGTLPHNAAGDLGYPVDNAPNTASQFQVGGDRRAPENVALSGVHTVFVREHNRICDELAALFPSWGDERLFWMARQVLTAEWHNIVYQEYLPLLLGKTHGLPRYTGYDDSINPNIQAFFSGAAFRFGHSLVSHEFERRAPDGTSLAPSTIFDLFFQPAPSSELMESVLHGACYHVCQKLDAKVVDGLRNQLFASVQGVGGIDLVSFNIQRGRDLAVPGYNDAREAYGLPRVASIAAFPGNQEMRNRLASVYSHIDDVDAWVGGLAEDRLGGESMVGPLLAAAIKDQFRRLRDGDRFYYENLTWPKALRDNYPLIQRIQDGQVRLRDILQRNTDIIAPLPNSVLVNRARALGSCTPGQHSKFCTWNGVCNSDRVTCTCNSAWWNGEQCNIAASACPGWGPQPAGWSQNPCNGHGKCLGQPGQAYCWCDPGYSGDGCQYST